MTDLIKPFTHDYDDYLRDESRRAGSADMIAFPTTEAEVVEVLREAQTRGLAVTTQGARTGLVAGAVPQGGLILNLSRMNKLGEIRPDEATGEHRLTVQPGALLSEIQKITGSQGLLFPPDPTETSASIGGMVASNASGALTYCYGSTRDWVSVVRVVLCDGSTIQLKRGENLAHGRSFSLGTEDGRLISGQLPAYTQPKTKSAASYYVVDDMDMVDLFIGMEGTLGVVTEIELRLISKPPVINGLTVFLPNEEAALKFVRFLRDEVVSARPAAIEFFNHDALDLLRKAKSENPAFAEIPALKPSFHTAIYVEFHGTAQDDLDEAIMQVMDAITALGGSDEDTWYATSDRELEPLKAFRHAIPEAVNLLIDERKKTCPDITKLGTDMSVPDEHLETVMAIYNAGLKENSLDSVIFGHIGNNHVHVNILPRDMGDYERGRSLYLSWAREIVALGGSVSGEHGIGKIKTPFLEMMYGAEAIAEMRALKALFDPEMRLNTGNLF